MKASSPYISYELPSYVVIPLNGSDVSVSPLVQYLVSYDYMLDTNDKSVMLAAWHGAFSALIVSLILFGCALLVHVLVATMTDLEMRMAGERVGGWVGAAEHSHVP